MVRDFADSLTRFVSHNNNPLGLLILGCSALLEYVFPPFPGDTVTLFGSFLVTRHDWSLLSVFASLLAGSIVGAMLDYWIGSQVGGRYRRGALIRSSRMRARVDRVLRAFRRHGVAYVALNRFLPGLRGVVFIAAGMAELKAGWVGFFAMVSAVLWNSLVLALGYAIGASWDRILSMAQTYGLVLWMALAAAALLLAVRWMLHRGR